MLNVLNVGVIKDVSMRESMDVSMDVSRDTELS
jgi:hypothetical protein